MMDSITSFISQVRQTVTKCKLVENSEKENFCKRKLHKSSVRENRKKVILIRAILPSPGLA